MDASGEIFFCRNAGIAGVSPALLSRLPCRRQVWKSRRDVERRITDRLQQGFLQQRVAELAATDPDPRARALARRVSG